LASCKNWVTLCPPLFSDTHSSLFKSATHPLRTPPLPNPPQFSKPARVHVQDFWALMVSEFLHNR
jgi:hypothetical protein